MENYISIIEINTPIRFFYLDSICLPSGKIWLLKLD